METGVEKQKFHAHDHNRRKNLVYKGKASIWVPKRSLEEAFKAAGL